MVSDDMSCCFGT